MKGFGGSVSLLHRWLFTDAASFLMMASVFFSVTACPHLSWGQESVLDQGPMPDSVEKLPDALKLEQPLPLPWLLPELRRILRDTLRLERPELSPFFRDTDVTLNLRTYYFNQDTNKVNAPDTFNEAWALGGSLGYQSGWWREVLSRRFRGSPRLRARQGRCG